MSHALLKNILTNKLSRKSFHAFSFCDFTIFHLEPVILLAIIAWAIIYGAEITTNLLMWKVCRLHYNYSEDICANLSESNDNT